MMRFPVIVDCMCGRRLQGDALEVDGLICECGRTYKFDWDCDSEGEDFVTAYEYETK